MTGQALLHFRVQGEGEPLILLHGLAGSHAWWARNVDACAGHFQTFCLDLAGFGGSRRLWRFRLEEAVPSLVRWMDSQQVDRANLVGHSMGGLIAARFAAEAPGRVSKLVLVDAAFLSFDSGLSKRASGIVRAIRSTPRDFFPVLVRDSLRAHPLSLLTATYDLLRCDWSDLLGGIAAPTLILWGENDTVTPLEIGESLHSAIRNSKFVVVNGAGHNLMWDQAERFNTELLNFLGEGD